MIYEFTEWKIDVFGATKYMIVAAISYCVFVEIVHGRWIAWKNCWWWLFFYENITINAIIFINSIITKAHFICT